MMALFSVGEEQGVSAIPKELLRVAQCQPAGYRYLAQANCAGGILEGLNYFRFLG